MPSASRWLPASLLLMVGCLPIPHPHTRTPGAEIRIVDAEDRPLRTANVHVYEGDVIGNAVASTQSATTDTIGRVALKYQRRWDLVYGLLPDMEAPSVWALCIDHPDYAPVMQPLPDAKSQRVAIVMTRSTSHATCPKMLNYHHGRGDGADSVSAMHE